MLEYLNQLPCETLGQHLLGFLELIDIIQWENAATSQKSQQLLRAILPYCPTIVVSDSWNRVHFNHIVCNWFSNRRCRVQFMRISIESLCEVNFEHSVLYVITFGLKENASLQDIESLNDPNIRDKITKLHIEGHQDPAVMELLFSVLSNSSVRCLDIQESNPIRWMEHIKKIGPCLRELTINSCSIEQTILTTVTKCCPDLEKLSFNLYIADSSILQSIASNCPYLRSLLIYQLHYDTSAAADADLTALAEKCPQMEELSLRCPQLTDQSVIALAQHCSRLKNLKLELNQCKFTAASLIALSVRGLPLEELGISSIPTLSAEIAAQCAQALSRIRNLEIYKSSSSHILYMTGLRELHVDCAEDYQQMLQGQCCAGLENLIIGSDSSITPQQLCELVTVCPQLHTLNIYKPTCSSAAVLVELARSCPHLQKVTLDSSEVTEEGVLALAAHCRQLREIHIPYTTLTEETVRQLAQYCRRLTKLRVTVREGEVMVGHYKQYSSKEIRVLRKNTSSRVPSPQHSGLSVDSHSYTLYIQSILGVCALLVVVYAYMVYKY